MNPEARTVEPSISHVIFINDMYYQVREPSLTGAQLATLGGVPDGNQIFLDVPGPGEDLPVGREEPIELKPGTRFYDVPAGNLG
jgi:multiubiquitin